MAAHRSGLRGNRGRAVAEDIRPNKTLHRESNDMSAKGATVLSRTKAKTKQEDALKNQPCPQRKVLSREAQHISIILENCIRQAEIAVSLPAVLRLNRESGVADEELSRALREHQGLDERLETLEGLKQEADGEEEGEAGEARKRTRAQLEMDIKKSVRDLFRLVRVHPDIINDLRAELVSEVGESEHELIRVLEKFHSHMVEMLLTSPDEELQLRLQKEASLCTYQDLEDIGALEEKAATTMKKIDADIAEKNEEIEQLKNSLQGDNVDTDMLLLADMQCQSVIKTSEMKQSSVQQNIDQLSVQLNNLMLENRQAERALQEKNEKVENEIEYLIQHFDDEMGEKQANLELNEMEYKREEDELRRLEKPFSVLELECNQIQEKRRLAEEKRQKEMKELELKTKAAIFAQAWWRGYSVRKALKNKSKSKKTKKGKGKKTK
ncbi:hypothetical protein L3Q82_023335 [Scortum barcoo]|uniref:Uncharacterized protein n=1 Tax=Scortum barcoo TaxID=214431 RepID=A0ACB8WYI7_9TELE|nr:hypothetical protein L3Q82_023335 [Scortum barcoo]